MPCQTIGATESTKLPGKIQEIERDRAPFKSINRYSEMKICNCPLKGYKNIRIDYNYCDTFDNSIDYKFEIQ